MVDLQLLLDSQLAEYDSQLAARRCRSITSTVFLQYGLAGAVVVNGTASRRRSRTLVEPRWHI
jgi:hypothetical protein